MIKLPKIIGLAGAARVGKDTFADILISLLPENKITKLSLAERLKRECAGFLEEYCDVEDPYEPENKQEIRAFWTWYADYKRARTNGQYFIDEVKTQISYLSSHGVYNTFIIPDIRYAEFTNDETQFVKENGILVYIDKYSVIDGIRIFTPPATPNEGRNLPLLRPYADFLICWENCNQDTGKIKKFCVPAVQEFINWIKSQPT